MYVTGRERKLLEILLNAQGEATIKELAHELDVSTRTVHRDMKNIEEILQSYHIKLERKAGSGFLIHGSVSDRERLSQAINEQIAFDYTPEERHVLLLSRLLEAKEPVKLFALANELGVTVATLSNDLDKLEESVSEFSLELVRKRGYGVEVRGEESDIREAISHLIMQHMDELDFLSLLRQHAIDSPQSPVDEITDQLLGMVDKEKLKEIEKYLENLRDSLPYHLADNAYIGLLVHLSLAIERIQQGETIDMAGDYLNSIKASKEYEIASGLIHDLEEAFEITIPEAEIGYTTMHLMGAKARYHKDHILEDTSLSVAFKAKQLVEIVSKDIGVDLQQSRTLLNDLVVHLKPSVYRIQQRMDIQNPLTEQIKEDYPELFQKVEKALNKIFPKLKFPQEETAYVVMHFASALLNIEDLRGLRVLVVCSSGIGTAKILAAKLQRQFKDIETVEHHSLFDLEKLSLDEYDLVISTINLMSINDYVQVNPILPTSDIHKVEHAIRRVRISGQLNRKLEKKETKIVEDHTLQSIRKSVESIQRYAMIVNQVLDGLSVDEIDGNTPSEALTQSCEHLSEWLPGCEGVIDELLNREKIGGLGIPDTKLALYHTRSTALTKVSFTIHNLKKPLLVKGMDNENMYVETLLLMLAPEDLHTEGLEVMSFISSLIVEDEECIEIFQSKEEERIIHYLSNQLHQFFKNKR